MMSVGLRPTFHKGDTSNHYELHIFDFARDIYGERGNRRYLVFISEEILFPTVDQLIEQIHTDKEETLNRLNIPYR